MSPFFCCPLRAVKTALPLYISIKYNIMRKEEYLKLRGDAIAWLQTKERDFKSGLAVLQLSGFKPVAVSKVAKWGEGHPFGVQKLQALIYEYIRLWADPKLADKDEKEDTPVKEEPVYQDQEEVENQCDAQGYPDMIRRVFHEFYARMGERRELHARAAAIQGNSDEEIALREELLSQVEARSLRMDILWAAKTRFEKERILPDISLFEPEEELGEKGGEDFVISPDASQDDLKKLKKNTNTKLIRARNMLDFQQETKADNPNSMPTGPKRAKYEKKVEQLTAFIEKIDFRIVELS